MTHLTAGNGGRCRRLRRALATDYSAILYVINVQLLAFVAGMVTRRIDLKRKVLTLLIPLGSWLILYNLPMLANEGQFAPLSSSGPYGILTGESPLWFLWAMFVSFVIARALGRYRTILLGVAALLAVLWPVIPAWTLLRGTGLVLPYMLLGVIWRRSSLSSDVRVQRAWPVLAVVFFVLAYLGSQLADGPVWVGTELPLSMLPVELLLTSASVVGCIATYGLARSLNGLVPRLLAFIGTASLGIYGFHWLLIVSLPVLTSAGSLVGILVLWLALMLASTMLTVLVGRSRLLTNALLGGRACLHQILSDTEIEAARVAA